MQVTELFNCTVACIQLNPPASEALKRMHMLAADPGIVAIMNKVLLTQPQNNNHVLHFFLSFLINYLLIVLFQSIDGV